MWLIKRIALYAAVFLAFPAIGAEHPGQLFITHAGQKIPFSIEIADTPETLSHGLMGRKTMPADHGMLFVFPQEIAAEMWMKNTPISLDMLFIDSHGRIVYIAQNTKPYSTTIISARQNVRAVLELKGGTAAARGITAGDSVIHPVFAP